MNTYKEGMVDIREDCVLRDDVIDLFQTKNLRFLQHF